MDIVDILIGHGVGLQFGDPTILGWTTTVVYSVAVLLSGACVRQSFANQDAWPHVPIWGFLALGLLFFGINKQLDLQTSLIPIVRATALKQGWYEHRHAIQLWFLIGMIVVSLALFSGMAWIIRSSWRNYWVLFIGLLMFSRFMVVRIASIVGVSLPRLSLLTGGLRINWLLELASLTVIVIVALHFLYTHSEFQQLRIQRNARR